MGNMGITLSVDTRELKPDLIVRYGLVVVRGLGSNCLGHPFLENILESIISFFALLFDFPFPLLDHLFRDDKKMPLTPDI